MWFSEQGLVDDLVEPTDEEVADALAVREAIRELLLANNGVEADAERGVEDARGGRPQGAPRRPLRERPPRPRSRGRRRPRRDRPHRRDGRGARADRRVEAAEDLPRRALPRRLLRPVAQPLARVVLDGGLRQPREGAQLPQAPRDGCGLGRAREVVRPRRGKRGRRRALQEPVDEERERRRAARCGDGRRG